MKIAVVQQPPVYLDLVKSMTRAVELVQEAAGLGCKMVVFPETWLPGYPTFVWRLSPGAGMKKTDELYALSQANSVDLSKDGLMHSWCCAQTSWMAARKDQRRSPNSSASSTPSSATRSSAGRTERSRAVRDDLVGCAICSGQCTAAPGI